MLKPTGGPVSKLESKLKNTKLTQTQQIKSSHGCSCVKQVFIPRCPSFSAQNKKGTNVWNKEKTSMLIKARQHVV